MRKYEKLTLATFDDRLVRCVYKNQAAALRAVSKSSFGESEALLARLLVKWHFDPSSRPFARPAPQGPTPTLGRRQPLDPRRDPELSEAIEKLPRRHGHWVADMINAAVGMSRDAARRERKRMRAPGIDRALIQMVLVGYAGLDQCDQAVKQCRLALEQAKAALTGLQLTP